MLRVLVLTAIILRSVRCNTIKLIFNSSNLTVNEGQPLDLGCGVEDSFRYCVWEHGEIVYQFEDVQENKVKGMTARQNPEKGSECDIKLSSAEPKDQGIWTCKVYIVGNVLEGSKRVVVVARPVVPKISAEQPLRVTANKEVSIQCSVESVDAPVKWYLENIDITSKSSKLSPEEMEENSGAKRQVFTLNTIFQPEDDGQVLQCVVINDSHPSVQDNRTLDVVFKPTGTQLTHFYGFQTKMDCEMFLVFKASPNLTHIEWTTSDDSVLTSVPGNSGRLQANITGISSNQYNATLKIRAFTKADYNTTLHLKVKNNNGESIFKIRLFEGNPSSSNKNAAECKKALAVASEFSNVPSDKPTGLSQGGIAAIVIVGLLVAVVVALVSAGKYFKQNIWYYVTGRCVRNNQDDAQTSKTDQESPAPRQNYSALSQEMSAQPTQTIQGYSSQLEISSLEEKNTLLDDNDKPTAVTSTIATQATENKRTEGVTESRASNDTTTTLSKSLTMLQDDEIKESQTTSSERISPSNKPPTAEQKKKIKEVSMTMEENNPYSGMEINLCDDDSESDIGSNEAPASKDSSLANTDKPLKDTVVPDQPILSINNNIFEDTAQTQSYDDFAQPPMTTQCGNSLQPDRLMSQLSQEEVVRGHDINRSGDINSVMSELSERIHRSKSSEAIDSPPEDRENLILVKESPNDLPQISDNHELRKERSKSSEFIKIRMSSEQLNLKNIVSELNKKFHKITEMAEENGQKIDMVEKVKSDGMVVGSGDTRGTGLTEHSD